MSEFETQWRACSNKLGKPTYKMNCLFSPSGLKAKVCRKCEADRKGYKSGSRRVMSGSLSHIWPERKQLPAREK
jgi:hypothetical protein